MKLSLLVFGDGSSIHTARILSGLSADPSLEVSLLSMSPSSVLDEVRSMKGLAAIYEVRPFSRPRVSGGNLQYLFSLPKLGRLVSRLRPDIICACYLSSYGVMASYVKGRSLLCHYLMGTDVMVSPFRGFFYRLATHYALRRGDFFVSSSQTLTQTLLRIYPVQTERILTRQYGVPDRLLEQPLRRPRFDMVSNRSWVPNSNIPFILQLCQGFSFRLGFCLIGSGGAEEKEIRSLAEKAENIVLPGHLSYEENLQIVSQSKFYVSLTSSDGASLSLIEAMALGAVPIVSDIPPNREWVEGGVNGFLIPMNDFRKAQAVFFQAFRLSEVERREMALLNRRRVARNGSFSKNMRLIRSGLKAAYHNRQILGRDPKGNGDA